MWQYLREVTCEYCGQFLLLDMTLSLKYVASTVVHKRVFGPAVSDSVVDAFMHDAVHNMWACLSSQFSV